MKTYDDFPPVLSNVRVETISGRVYHGEVLAVYPQTGISIRDFRNNAQRWISFGHMHRLLGIDKYKLVVCEYRTTPKEPDTVSGKED